MVACLGQPISWSMAAMLLNFVVTCTCPQAILLTSLNLICYQWKKWKVYYATLPPWPILWSQGKSLATLLCLPKHSVILGLGLENVWNAFRNLWNVLRNFWKSDLWACMVEPSPKTLGNCRLKISHLLLGKSWWICISLSPPQRLKGAFLDGEYLLYDTV